MRLIRKLKRKIFRRKAKAKTVIFFATRDTMWALNGAADRQRITRTVVINRSIQVLDLLKQLKDTGRELPKELNPYLENMDKQEYSPPSHWTHFVEITWGAKEIRVERLK